MKKYLKELLPAIIITITMSFMFFIYEPFTVYSANTEDFWFDIRILLSNNILFFIITVLILVIINGVVLFFSNHAKKEKIYDIFILIFNVVFVSTYIQGNYLAGKLPALDGSPIEWSNYTTLGVISCILIVIVLAINIFLFVKFTEKYKKIITGVSLAIFAMLAISLVSILASNNQIYSQKGIYTATNKDINKLSTDKNFLILLVDMEDSKTFDKVLKEEGKDYLFKDFTYFPDTLSAYPFTRESIPYILSGIWFEEKTSFADYFNIAFNESKFLEKLKNDNYDINIYEQELSWTDSKSLEVKNIEAINSDVNKFTFFKQELKYILFKYLPFPLKKYSKIENLDYSICRIDNTDTENIFKSDNKITYDVLDKISLQNNKYFQFVHVDGGHFPWDMNKNFEKIEDGTYEDKIGASITLIEKYMDRIKESGQYDNSVIIVLADHGNNGYDAIGRQNPILYIKGIDEKHDEMQISDKKVTYEDLNETIYYDLLDGKKSEELLPNIEEDRIRRFIWYRDYDDMYEQTLDGHAWETEKLINTGERYKK